MQRPNILWISFEDTSPRFGCYGDELAQTPNVDRLAREGIRFPNAFSVAGVCAPSRSAIITGMYPTYTGAHHMRTTHRHPAAPGLATPYEAVIPPYCRLLPETLRSHGYYTCNNDKTDYQFQSPFTAWHDCSTKAHWRNRKKGQPFFAVFNNTQTHESGMWPEKGPKVTIDASKLKLPPYIPDTPDVRDALARQYQNIASNDLWAGELLQQLEEDGELENTIIFFWSDHGEGLPRAKRWPYDAGIHIPLIVRLPGGERAGAVDQRLVSLIDLYPTTLSLAGIPLPAWLQGQPFLRETDPKREYIFATRDRYDESYDRVRAIRDGRFKYIRHYYPYTPYLSWIPYRNRHPSLKELWRRKESGQLSPDEAPFMGLRPPEELYDIENDPHELSNLANNPQQTETLHRLRAALDHWQDRFDRYGDVPESQMVRSWHPDGEQPTTAAAIALPAGDDSTGQAIDKPLAACRSGSLIQIHCSTQGATTAYRLDDGPWTLYREPFSLPENCQSVTTKSIRIGFKESPEMTYAVGGD